MGEQTESGIEELFYRYSLDLMAIVGPDGYFKKVNPAFKQVLGYSEDEIFSRPVVSFLHPDDVERTRKGIETLTTGTQRRASRNRYLLKTGGYRWFSWDTNPIGKDFYTIGRDITEQVGAEEQIRELNRTLKEQNRQLAAASQSKSQFLANMSHELRTPLNAIIGFSEVLRDGLIGEVSAEQKEYLTDIYSSGQHLLSLINDILDLSKVESGKMELTPEFVEMLGLLENGLTIVKETAASRGIQLELRHEELPDTILADSRRLKQIVYNLLTNAVKFSPPGTRVTLNARRCRRAEISQWQSRAPTARIFSLPENDNDDYVEISVHDGGRGITPEDAPKLFQAFSQVDTTLSREVEGTGLGLLLTLNLVRLHHGAMAMESIPNVGSTFTFWIPASVAAVAPTHEALHLTADTAPPIGRTVLVIEDNEQAANLVRRQLEAEGLTVLHAHDAVQGFLLLQNHDIALIVLDILLPDIDGWEFLRQIKLPGSAQSRIPVIVLTILDDNKAGFALGAAQVLQKPVSREAFHAALEALGLDQSGRSSKILVIDDDENSVNLIRAFLGEGAYEIHAAYDGFTGVDKARAEKPDLIVLDLLMPDITGFGVLDIIRRDAELRNTPVVIVTSKTLSPAEREELRKKMAQVLIKSELNQQNLLAEIHRALQKS